MHRANPKRPTSDIRPAALDHVSTALAALEDAKAALFSANPRDPGPEHAILGRMIHELVDLREVMRGPRGFATSCPGTLANAVCHELDAGDRDPITADDYEVF